MPERDIFVTPTATPRMRDREHVQQLDDELDRAHVVASSEIPGDVVTMNFELALRDLDTGEAHGDK